MNENKSRHRVTEKPNLSLLALMSFVASFIAARTFTMINPDVNLIISGYHIHHFWFGLAMLVIGGWMGIAYQSERTDRLAAILFGAGGGIVGDEVGLLLTLQNYWTEITYTIITVFLAIVSILVLINRYSAVIHTEFYEFLRSNASLYVGVFMAAVSIAFFLETTNIIITLVSGVLTIAACVMVVAYFVQHYRRSKRL